MWLGIVRPQLLLMDGIATLGGNGVEGELRRGAGCRSWRRAIGIRQRGSEAEDAASVGVGRSSRCWSGQMRSEAPFCPEEESQLSIRGEREDAALVLGHRDRLQSRPVGCKQGFRSRNEGTWAEASQRGGAPDGKGRTWVQVPCRRGPLHRRRGGRRAQRQRTGSRLWTGPWRGIRRRMRAWRRRLQDV